MLQELIDVLTKEKSNATGPQFSSCLTDSHYTSYYIKMLYTDNETGSSHSPNVLLF